MRPIRILLFSAATLTLAGPALAQEGDATAPPRDQPFGFASACSPEFLRLIDPCVIKSRQTFGHARERFESGLPEGHSLLVVMLLRDGSGNVEQVFVKVRAVNGLSIVGYLASQIVGIRGFKLGDPVVLSEREIVDWVIVSPDGKEEGNLIGKYLDALQAGKVSTECSGA